MHAAVLSATENRFAVLDGFQELLPTDPGDVARRTAAESAGVLDGILLLLPPSHGGDCRMVLYNADGSRPEACGNGLRCIAKLAVERRHVDRDSLVVETDGGLRAVRVVRRAGVVRHAVVTMGAPRIEERDATLATTHGNVHAMLVDMGNPHCVLFVDDVATADVHTLGTELERHGRFPNRTNVEFVSVHEDLLTVRIWERGVGETASCGTGVSAAAVAAIDRGVALSPVHVRTRGGDLRVEWSRGGVVCLEGPVSDVEDEIELTGGA